jgi:RNA:NAD 2'-phosphotransferase (TPT1/KptA family)
MRAPARRRRAEPAAAKAAAPVGKASPYSAWKTAAEASAKKPPVVEAAYGQPGQHKAQFFGPLGSGGPPAGTGAAGSGGPPPAPAAGAGAAAGAGGSGGGGGKGGPTPALTLPPRSTEAVDLWEFLGTEVETRLLTLPHLGWPDVRLMARHRYGNPVNPGRGADALGHFLSRCLRHRTAGVEVAADGFADAEIVLRSASHATGHDYQLYDLYTVVRHADKARFQCAQLIDASRVFVRCLQGHSLEHVQDEYILRRVSPADVVHQVVFHTTQEPAAWEILRNGLIPGGPGMGEGYRLHVHMAPRLPALEGRAPGARHEAPVRVEITGTVLAESVETLWVSGPGALLTRSRVPPEAILRISDARTGEQIARGVATGGGPEHWDTAHALREAAAETAAPQKGKGKGKGKRAALAPARGAAAAPAPPARAPARCGTPGGTHSGRHPGESKSSTGREGLRAGSTRRCGPKGPPCTREGTTGGRRCGRKGRPRSWRSPACPHAPL